MRLWFTQLLHHQLELHHVNEITSISIIPYKEINIYVVSKTTDNEIRAAECPREHEIKQMSVLS